MDSHLLDALRSQKEALDKQTQVLDRLCDAFSKVLKGAESDNRSDKDIYASESSDSMRIELKLRKLDKKLEGFSYAFQQFGSSRVASSVTRLRERLACILFVLTPDNTDLFHTHAIAKRHQSTFDQPKTENLSSYLRSLADDLILFRHGLYDFPEFKDDALDGALASFNTDVEFWASRLASYQGSCYQEKPNDSAVQRYIDDISCGIGRHADRVTPMLLTFIELGVPTISLTRQYATSTFLNLITVATLFSGVTATTLQISYTSTDTPIAAAINFFWFCSLVCSVGAVVNSLLSLTWNQVMSGSTSQFPWWIAFWIKRSPLVFLVTSVACFLVGLVLFTYSSGQPLAISIVTSVLTAFTCCGIAAVLAWFTLDRQIFLSCSRSWPQYIHASARTCSLVLGRVPIIRKASYWVLHCVRVIRIHVTNVASLVSLNRRGSENGNRQDSSGSLPFASHPRELRPSTSPLDMKLGPSNAHRLTEDAPFTTSPDTLHKSIGFFADKKKTAPLAYDNTYPIIPSRQNTSLTLLGSGESSPKRTLSDPAVSSQSADLARRLQSLQSTHTLDMYQGSIVHLKFSPDGKFLFTNWDKTYVIFCVADSFLSHNVLVHPEGSLGVNEVAWSPRRNLLLTTTLLGIVSIWTQHGVCRKTIDCMSNDGRMVQSIVWLPSAEAFLCVKDNIITKLDTDGKVLDTYDTGHLDLTSIAVTSDSQRLVGVGFVSGKGLLPTTFIKVHNTLVVYNLGTKEMEYQVPVFGNVSNVVVARNGFDVLVNFWDNAFPQVRRFAKALNDMVLVHQRTHVLEGLVDSALQSGFGGRNDELVVCNAESGDIYIWDRESLKLLHRIPSKDAETLELIAWNPAADDPFMLAMASSDGSVTIWTSQAVATLPTQSQVEEEIIVEEIPHARTYP